jgi:hypothetical protein
MVASLSISYITPRRQIIIKMSVFLDLSVEPHSLLYIDLLNNRNITMIAKAEYHLTLVCKYADVLIIESYMPTLVENGNTSTSNFGCHKQ